MENGSHNVSRNALRTINPHCLSGNQIITKQRSNHFRGTDAKRAFNFLKFYSRFFFLYFDSRLLLLQEINKHNVK